ncbi:hypothetical protein [Falsiroseomonas sp. E2-1-a20]|uniref:hypothetical protein n=1 Tax=Falsiroseomonas sp. E2-1-a20 TaxID=3239300 RepID=UPI003F38C1BD
MRLNRLALLGTVLILPTLLAPAAVQAQGIVRPADQPTAPRAAAPALPGLTSRNAPAPIPRQTPGSLAPNAALFDAISRGDIAAARDAVARGANIEARNALGLSPLDAAVDQGRNEIAFYLLSARDRTRNPAAAPSAEDVAAGPRPSLSTPTARPAAPRAPLQAPPALAATPAASAVGAQLWAGNGGAPRPEIGFLGFDAGRPAGATPPEAPAAPGRRVRR